MIFLMVALAIAFASGMFMADWCHLAGQEDWW